MTKPKIAQPDDREFFAAVLWDKNTRCCPVVIRSQERLGERPLTRKAKILRSASVDDIFLPDWPGFNLGPDPFFTNRKEPDENEDEVITGHFPLLEAARNWLLSRK